MAGGWREELPASITVPLDELRNVIAGLEECLEQLIEAKLWSEAERIDRLIGRMTRWVWGLLAELDDDEYDP